MNNYKLTKNELLNRINVMANKLYANWMGGCLFITNDMFITFCPDGLWLHSSHHKKVSTLRMNELRGLYIELSIRCCYSDAHIKYLLKYFNMYKEDLFDLRKAVKFTIDRETEYDKHIRYVESYLTTYKDMGSRFQRSGVRKSWYI